MAGSINHFENCSKGYDKHDIQMEMSNVASMKDTSVSLTQQKSVSQESMQQQYIQADVNIQGSILSLKESDTQPLTGPHICVYEECMKFHSPARNDPESPVSPLKTSLFYLVLILLVLWILVYTLLSKMNYI